MATNGIDLDDGILDPLELDGSDTANTGYVPKFERDLAQAGGNLNALSEAKKAETASSDEIKGEIDLSSLRSEEEYAELKAADEQETEFVTEEELDDYATLDAYNENPHTDTEQEIVSETHTGPKSFADFAREAEEAEKRAQAKKLLIDEKTLDGVDVSNTMLSDMKYDSRKDQSRSIRQQMEMDDIAISMGNKPIIEDMAKEYAPTPKKAEDLALKDVLDRDERQIIKKRLEDELGKNAHRSNKRTSLQMYHDLMNQQKVRKAKQGFFVVLLLMAFGIITAVISYFKLWTGNEELWSGIPVLMYIPFATGFFALLLLVKAKFAKILSTLYFAVNTVILIGPGFVKFCIDNSENGLSDHIFMVIYFVAAILLSAIICIQLCTNEKVEAYYSTHLITEDKKVFDERKSKYKQ